MSSQSYFAKQAEAYDERLKSGLLGKVRNAEKDVVMEKLDPKEGEVILDIPCGSGYYASFIVAARAEVYGIDISKEMIAVFKKKGYKGETGNLEKFSVAKKFDKVLSAGGFEFCKDHQAIIRNCIFHTKKNGKIVLLVPRKCFFGYLYKLYHRVVNKTNITIFSEKEIIELCRNNSVKHIAIQKAGLFAFVIELLIRE